MSSSVRRTAGIVSSVVGVIADTHGLVRSEALEALSGSDHIVHAGDVGDPDVLDALATIGPVTAVRGNNDWGVWAEALARSEVVEVEAALLYVIHDLGELDLDPSAAELHAVITGHFHQPSVDTRDGVLYLNPGSAGPRRLDYPVTVARLHVRGHDISPEIIRLSP
jgi:putative phosphoesterase